MSLEHILLGMLHEPASGYDIKSDFSQGTRHFWSAELSQIYPTLKKLENRGWLRSRIEPPVKGPPRRVYHRTAEGRGELIEWLKAGPQMGTERFAYVAQLCFMHELEDLEATTDFMLDLRSRLGEFLALLLQAESEFAGNDTGELDNLNSEDFHVFLAVRMGIHSLRAKVQWCEEALGRIELRRQPKDVKHPEPKRRPKEVRSG